MAGVLGQEQAWTRTSAFSLGGRILHGSCVSGRSLTGRQRASGRLPTRLLQCGAGHAHSHLCPLAAAVVAWVSTHLRRSDGGSRATTKRGPASWRMPAAVQACPQAPPGLCGSGCGWHARQACLGHTGQRRNSQQHSSQPGLCQHVSWRTRGPPSSRTGSSVSGGVRRAGAYAQRGIWGGTHG